MTLKSYLKIAALTAPLLFTGCASMFSGDMQTLTIKSNPVGAKVSLNGRDLGQTPLTTTVEKKKDMLLTVSKEGYRDVTQPLNTSFDPMALVGIFSYGTPITTDVQKGTAYQLSPNYYQVELPKEEK